MKRRTSLLEGGWVAIVPLTVALVAYLFVVFFPGMREIRELRAEAAVHEQAAADARRQAGLLPGIEAEIAETSSYVRKWRGTDDDPRHVSQALGDIANLISRSGATTTSFRPEAKTSFAALDRLPLILGCRGTYRQVQSLLSSLERQPQRLWIEEVQIERAAGTDGTLACEIRLALFADKFDISD